MNELQAFAANKWGTQPAEGSAADGYSSAVAFALHPLHGAVVLKRPKVHRMYLAEKRALQLLGDARFPAPQLLGFDDKSGTLLLSFLTGENLASRTAPPDARTANQLGQLLAAFHAVTPPADYPKKNDAASLHSTFLRDYSFMQQHLEAALLADTGHFAEQGFAAAAKNDFSCLTHGDFRLGNVVQNGEHLYLLDFESSAVGDRMSDFCKMLSQELPQKLHRPFLDGYIALCPAFDESRLAASLRFYTALESLSALRWCILVGRKDDAFYLQNLQTLTETVTQ